MKVLSSLTRRIDLAENPIFDEGDITGEVVGFQLRVLYNLSDELRIEAGYEQMRNRYDGVELNGYQREDNITIKAPYVRIGYRINDYLELGQE